VSAGSREVAEFSVVIVRGKGRRLALRLSHAGTLAADADWSGEWEPDQEPEYAAMLARKNPQEQKRAAAIAKALGALLDDLTIDISGERGAQLREALNG
jgi:hypothetical protein